jgi:hypothetical protein
VRASSASASLTIRLYHHRTIVAEYEVCAARAFVNMCAVVIVTGGGGGGVAVYVCVFISVRVCPSLGG